MLLLLSPWHNNLNMTSWFWRHFWQTHANCHASIDRARPALSANAWQLAQVGQNYRQKTFARAAMWGCLAPPLSLVDNIKIYFINNTHYFNMRFYNIIKLYKVWLACYFGGRHCHIGDMVLSVMTQQRAIIDNAVHCPLSPSTCRRGTLASLCHSPMFAPLLHPLLLRARPFLVGCCVIMFDRRLPKATIYLLLYIFLSFHLLPQTIGRCPLPRSTPPSRLSYNIPPTASADSGLIVGCLDWLAAT
jgi:hypothetical protein